MPGRDYDVFISHSQQDKATAEAICRELENSGVRCWIAPRDISEGDDWTASIMDGINQCRVMVMVFSGHTNRSAHVHREVSHAFKRGLIVIPFRVEEIEASERFEYYLESVQWLNAFPPPIEQYFPRLTERATCLLAKEKVSKRGTVAAADGILFAAPTTTGRAGPKAFSLQTETPARASPGNKGRRKPLAIAIVAAVFASGATAAVLGLMGSFRSKEKEVSRVANPEPIAVSVPTPVASPLLSPAIGATQITLEPEMASPTPALSTAPVVRETASPASQLVAAVVPRSTSSPVTEERASVKTGFNFTNSAGQSMVWIRALNIWAAAHETTQRQYQRVANANPSAFLGPDRPVDSVTWYDAVRYCDALTEMEQAAGTLPSGFRYRLPKDREWSVFAGGAEISQAVHGRSNRQGTSNVGSRGGNRYGLYDILGNVWEWCLEDYSPSMDSAAVRAQLPDLSRSGKVLRGGSWSTAGSSVMLRADTHGSDRPGEVSNTDGFRVVLASEN